MFDGSAGSFEPAKVLGQCGRRSRRRLGWLVWLLTSLVYTSDYEHRVHSGPPVRS
jgi:hypothetical protein